MLEPVGKEIPSSYYLDHILGGADHRERVEAGVERPADDTLAPNGRDDRGDGNEPTNPGKRSTDSS
jgi:hypothetical protein